MFRPKLITKNPRLYNCKTHALFFLSSTKYTAYIFPLLHQNPKAAINTFVQPSRSRKWKVWRCFDRGILVLFVIRFMGPCFGFLASLFSAPKGTIVSFVFQSIRHLRISNKTCYTNNNNHAMHHLFGHINLNMNHTLIRYIKSWNHNPYMCRLVSVLALWIRSC